MSGLAGELNTAATDSLLAMLDLSSHRVEFVDRMASARNLVVSGEQTVNTSGDISRETRGLAVVLTFAAYENLIKKLSISILEEVGRSRAKNRRLRPGYKLIATKSLFQSLIAKGDKSLWTGTGMKLMEMATSPTHLNVRSNVWPDDGSYMKRSQVVTLCTVFGFSDPSIPLDRIWSNFDGVVSRRNAIAHGQRRADEVGRDYSFNEVMQTLDNWEFSWCKFIDWVENQCVDSTFYLLPR